MTDSGTQAPGGLSSAPFLLFDGNCAEAMGFYHDCLGGELTVTRLGDTPMRDAFPPATHDRTINAHLESELVAISAADWMAPDFDPVRGNMSAIFVTGPVGARLSEVFDRLKDGTNNTRLQELHELPFGLYGQFYDRYGVQWIFRGDAA